uniref:Pepdidase_M14_N domain-containing protein n=1 Tax=Steinernema glaseri TaxID=37863 RepID=A0A1I8A8D1_9BILA
MLPKSVGKFVKKAFPDTVADDERPKEASDLLDTSSNVAELSQTVAREICSYQQEFEMGQKRKREVVHDLDQLVLEDNCVDSAPSGFEAEKPLHFESRFESGNLRKAYRIGTPEQRHYELVLSPDTGSNRPHYQWFYFEVSNNEADQIYTFDIINCSKGSSMFSRGMQPVIFSVGQYMETKRGWARGGRNICYFRNRYISNREVKTTPKKAPKGRKMSQSGSPKPQKPQEPQEPTKTERQVEQCHHYTLRFQLAFQKQGDVTYIAYHYPFTYSRLRV